MPKGFDKCRQQGGKIRTIKGPDKKWKVPPKRYRHVCILPDGKTYKGYLKTYKKKKLKATKKKISKKQEREVRKAKKGAKWNRKVDRKMRIFGEIDYKKKLIRVNPKKGEIVNTIVHEEMHKRFPKKSEKEIRKLTKKRESELSVKQSMKLLGKFAKKKGRQKKTKFKK